MGRAIDLFVTYRFIKLLVTPFEKTDAFKLGIIDKDGNVLFEGGQYMIRFKDHDGNEQYIPYSEMKFAHRNNPVAPNPGDNAVNAARNVIFEPISFVYTSFGSGHAWIGVNYYVGSTTAVFESFNSYYMHHEYTNAGGHEVWNRMDVRLVIWK